MDIYTSTIISTINSSIPFLLAGLGENITEKAGVLNLGCEGMMLMGAVSGFLGTWYSGSLMVGLLFAGGVGIIMALLMAYMAVTRNANQMLSGLLIWLLGLGLANIIYQKAVGVHYMLPTVDVDSYTSFLKFIPLLGPYLVKFNIMVYLAGVLVIATYLFLFKTPIGLNIRAVGENPRAADTAGIDVAKTRYGALIIAGLLAGWAGAYMSLFEVGAYTEHMTGGRGFIVLVIVILGKWNPWKILAGSLLFGFADIAQYRLQNMGVDIPSQFLLMIPYFLTIIMLVALRKQKAVPSALNHSYRRGD